MATIHQSDLSSWIRCPTAYSYGKQGLPRKQLSATAYGSVVHHALETFERLRHTDGVTFVDACEAAIATFEHYWHPMNIEAITQPVDIWLPKQGYSELRARGIENIRAYCTLVRLDDHQLLATEFGFQVPIPGTWDEELGEPHILAGTLDKLSLRRFKTKAYLAIEDFKTGKEQRYLRQNLQFTAYALATTQQEFWTGWRGEDGFGALRGLELFHRFENYARRGTWINLRTVKFMDAGWRGPADYTRFALAVEQLVASWRADIYPLSLSGETCTFCEFREICAGVGVPDTTHGAP